MKSFIACALLLSQCLSSLNSNVDRSAHTSRSLPAPRLQAVIVPLHVAAMPVHSNSPPPAPSQLTPFTQHVLQRRLSETNSHPQADADAETVHGGSHFFDFSQLMPDLQRVESLKQRSGSLSTSQSVSPTHTSPRSSSPHNHESHRHHSAASHDAQFVCDLQLMHVAHCSHAKSFPPLPTSSSSSSSSASVNGIRLHELQTAVFDSPPVVASTTSGGMQTPTRHHAALELPASLDFNFETTQTHDAQIVIRVWQFEDEPVAVSTPPVPAPQAKPQPLQLGRSSAWHRPKLQSPFASAQGQAIKAAESQPQLVQSHHSTMQFLSQHEIELPLPAESSSMSRMNHNHLPIHTKHRLMMRLKFASPPGSASSLQSTSLFAQQQHAARGRGAFHQAQLNQHRLSPHTSLRFELELVSRCNAHSSFTSVTRIRVVKLSELCRESHSAPVPAPFVASKPKAAAPVSLPSPAPVLVPLVAPPAAPTPVSAPVPVPHAMPPSLQTIQETSPQASPLHHAPHLIDDSSRHLSPDNISLFKESRLSRHSLNGLESLLPRSGPSPPTASGGRPPRAPGPPTSRHLHSMPPTDIQAVPAEAEKATSSSGAAHSDADAEYLQRYDRLKGEIKKYKLRRAEEQRGSTRGRGRFRLIPTRQEEPSSTTVETPATIQT